MRYKFALIAIPDGPEPIEERMGMTLSDYLLYSVLNGRRLPDACGYIADTGRGAKHDLVIYELPDSLHPQFPGEPMGHAVCRELTDLVQNDIRRGGFTEHLRAIGVSPDHPDAELRVILVPDELTLVTALALSKVDQNFPETSVSVFKYS